MLTCGVCGTGIVRNTSSWMCSECEQKLIEANKRKENTTIYHYDEYHDFYTCAKCDLAWALGNDEGLEKNQMYYCPKCGRRIAGVEGGNA